MCGARITGGLDLTFEVYGHLIDRHERIIGLVCEAAWGRLVSSSDRSLVYSAMVKLQNRGLIYKGCLTNRFVIADNKVRLVELNQIAWQYHNEDPQKFEKYAQTYHWNQLEQLFEELDQIGPHGNSRLPLIKFTAIAATAKNIVFLPSTSSPYLRVSDSHSRREIFIERVFSFLNDLPDDENEDRPYNALTRNSAPRRRRALLFSISSSPSTRNMYVFAKITCFKHLTAIIRRLEYSQQNHRPRSRQHIVLSHFLYPGLSRVQISRENSSSASSASTDDIASSYSCLD